MTPADYHRQKIKEWVHKKELAAEPQEVNVSRLQAASEVE